MSAAARKILLKYWGYSSFRPLQEEIVDAVIAGEDTLALLPTGGGKSICFQVPSMVMDGMCLVITPLIALMKDQVQHLKKSGIPAAAIYSGMHYNEIELAYNQAVFNKLKFLYISPERLATERFVETIKRMKVNLLAIDESHCISQWGYDFRPPYLHIADIRPYLPDVPVLALTATATPQVVEDIQDKLNFRKRQIFQSSYERKNITYNLISEPDKFGTLFRLFRQLKAGSGIVYVRNRKRTREIADWLSNKGISATYYHAGLDAKLRDHRQQSWMFGKQRVMVSTNAFGMGIDKPDVRLVVHMDLPDSLEAYFQEAGRAGRDGKAAETYLIVSEGDIKQLKSGFESAFPPMKQIKTIYDALGNFLQVPVGAGKDQSFDFNLLNFAKTYGFDLMEVYNSLRLLEKEGIIAMAESLQSLSRIFVKANREDLYRFQLEQPAYDGFIKFLLRSFPGILSDFVAVREDQIADKTGMTAQKVIDYLNKLHQLQFLTYAARKDRPQLVMVSERREAMDIYISTANYADRKNSAAKRIQAVIDFVRNDRECRSIQLLAYFGEKHRQRCGKCDVCIGRNKLSLSDVAFKQIQTKIFALLATRPYPVYEAASSVSLFPEEKVLEAIRWMLDNKQIEKDENGYLHLKNQLRIDV
ncbi:MAG: RecQ family ATP-dependent DNA helicase [Bacteroidetes bacterium]|jgi:ATP-dependent DNA helicase RecQ|nr:RecQ family ATP-dependent DNA helicase [Bacteroidota bacterium]